MNVKQMQTANGGCVLSRLLFPLLPDTILVFDVSELFIDSTFNLV